MLRHRRGTIGVGLVLVIGLVMGARWFLASALVASMVADRLQTMLDVPVRVGTVCLGLFGDSTAGQVQVFEKSDASSAKSWLQVDHVQVNVSVLDLLRGTVPSDVKLRGLALELRFDAQGKLLTQLPASPDGPRTDIPGLHIESSRLTLAQEGRPALVVNGIAAEVTGAAAGPELTGTVDDAYWGKWQATAGFDPSGNDLTLRLLADQVPVNQAKLEALPFVPASVWEQVKADGVTPVDLTLRFNTGANEPAVHYRVALEPKNTRVHVSSIGLDADNAHGKVVIEDELVQLRDVIGTSADGEIHTSADLDFRTEMTTMRFLVKVRDAAVSKLPKAWAVPLLDGLLNGDADLRLTVQDGKLKTGGRGEAVITNPRLIVPLPNGGKPRPPIHLELRADGDRYRPNLLRSAIKTLLPAILPFLMPAGEPEAAAPADAPLYLQVTMADEDLELAPILQQAGVKLPFPVTGRLSCNLVAGIPLDTPQDLRAYRLCGAAQLAGINVAGVPIEKVAARLWYDDGILRLDSIRGDVPGAIQGEVRCEIAPRGDLTCRFNMDPLPARSIRELVPALEDLDGMISATVLARLPFAHAADPKTWQAAAVVRGQGIRVGGVAVKDVSGTLSIGQGIALLSGVTIGLDELTGTGAAHVVLDGAFPYQARMDWPGIDLPTLGNRYAIAALRKPVSIHGAVNLTAAANGTLRPFSTVLTVAAPTSTVRVQGVTVQHLKGEVKYRDGTGQVQLRGDALGGLVKLQGDLPALVHPGETDRPVGSMRIERLKLSRLAAALRLGHRLNRLGGVVELELPFRLDAATGLPIGQGQLTARDIRWADRDLINNLQADLRLSTEELQVRNVAGSLGEGLVRGGIVLNLPHPERSRFKLVLERVEASTLVPELEPGFPTMKGPLDAQLRGRFDREWQGTAEVVMGRGKIMGVDITECRLPLEYTFAPSQGNAQVDIRDFAAQAASGRVTGRASLAYDADSLRVEGNLRFIDAELRGLLGAGGDLGPIGQGRLSGRVDFAGSEMHSLDDLTANLDATFNHTEAFNMPVLRSLGPLLGQTPSAVFHKGQIQARLARGIIRVRKLTLSSAFLDLLLEGTATLQGRLNLDVTTRSGTAESSRDGLRLLRLPAEGVAIPAKLFADATQLVARGLVHFRITGTVRAPAVRAEPLPLLSDEGLRFFIQGFQGR